MFRRLLPFLLGTQRRPGQPEGGPVGGELTAGNIWLNARLGGWITMPRQIYINTDNDVVWAGLRYDYDGVYVTDADVTCELLDAAGVSVVADVPLTYVTGTDGDYKGVIDQAYTVGLTEGDDYYIELSATFGDADGFRRIRRKAAYHGVQ